MASKQDEANELLEKQNRKLFFDHLKKKHRDLAKRQREYKEILAKRHKTRGDTIIEKSLSKAVDTLHHERNALRAQIWVANGVQHVAENNRYLQEIKCHVDCQANLTKEIGQLKVAIVNMERVVSRSDREIYELNRQIVPEPQHQQHVARTRKQMGILENQLEVGMRRESIFSAENARLRVELRNILHDREQFNHLYTKLVQFLNSDKKYITDLVEFAVNTYDNCINVSERTEFRMKKIKREQEARMSEVKGLIRTFTANQVIDEFMGTKGKTRPIAPHQPKELLRRAEYKQFHLRRIKLYNEEIDKLLQPTETHTVQEIIDRYQQHESLYYSYFRLDNEREYHITILNNIVNRLYQQVESLKVSNFTRYNAQFEAIEVLEEKLEERKARNRELALLKQSETQRLHKFLGDLQSIINACRLENKPLLALLGDHRQVNLVNLKRFTRILEKRLAQIVKHVYLSERTDPGIPLDKYTVKEIDKQCEMSTRLADIVLTQQCPECAEGEAFTADDTGDGWIPPFTRDEAKKLLFEKVNQPEMQYRLHSISQCRLPRSRILAAKRNT